MSHHLVFFQHQKIGDNAEEAFKRHGIKCCRLDGSIKDNQRSKLINIWREDPELHVLLISFGVGGAGLNLMEAKAVILLEAHDTWVKDF